MKKLKDYGVETMSMQEAITVNGGSEASRFLSWLGGVMFAMPSIMARNGAAGHEIMGSN